MIATSWYHVGACNRCGKCCEIMTFYKDRSDEGSDKQSYAQAHMLAWRPHPYGDGMIAPIYASCRHHMFMPDRKRGCELHGTPEQPEMCRTWPDRFEEFYAFIDVFWGCSVRLLWADDTYLEGALMPEALG